MNTQIYDEASEWIVRHRSDSLDADARRRFDAWLRESPQHLGAYLEMSSIWEDVPALDPDWNASADELIARARKDNNVFPLGESRSDERVDTTSTLTTLAGSGVSGVSGQSLEVPGESGQTREPHRKQKEERTNPRLLFSIAASLLIAVGIAGWLHLQRGIYSTDIGEQRTIALDDGSNIELNARSKIRIRYTDHERAIHLLRGQALFRVAKDPNRPFIVESDGTHVRAVGTQFDVYKRSIGTIVTVVEGRVAVLTAIPGAHVGSSSGTSSNTPEPPDAGTVYAEADKMAASLTRKEIAEANGPHSRPDLVYLTAGEQLTITPAVTAITPKLANIEAATAWTQQRLIFDFSPLTEVAEEFNRYNRRPLVIDDASLQGFHVSGSFSSTDPTLLLRFLRDQPGIAVNETASEIRISRRPGAG